MSAMPEATQSGMIAWFARCGFKTNPLTKLCHSVEELIAFHRRIEEQRAALDYDIDGVVYKLDRIDWQERLRFLSRPPRRADAHKIPRSEERRGGEEGRSRGAPDHLKKKKHKSAVTPGRTNTRPTPPPPPVPPPAIPPHHHPPTLPLYYTLPPPPLLPPPILHSPAHPY